MVARKKIEDVRSAAEIDADVDFTGWDPYIVAITGGAQVDLGDSPHSGMPPTPATESRELRLMAWLRKHGA